MSDSDIRSGTNEKARIKLGGDFGEIITIRAEISPLIGLREKWESPPPTPVFFSFFLFSFLRIIPQTSCNVSLVSLQLINLSI